MDKHCVVKYLKSVSNDDVAKTTRSFFKTNKGEYSYGDIFLGIKVPNIRKAIKKFPNIPLNEIEILLGSKYHEVRHFALLYMVTNFAKANQEQKRDIYKVYLKNTKHVNNWDLVDSSAHYIVGAYLQDKDKEPLYTLAHSRSLWERRIAIVSTFYFIKNNQFDDTLKIAKILLNDKEDLIHKAVGWMLRELGKRNKSKEISFLDMYHKTMPRVMLRYAIEKFSKEQRKDYLAT